MLILTDEEQSLLLTLLDRCIETQWPVAHLVGSRLLVQSDFRAMREHLLHRQRFSRPYVDRQCLQVSVDPQ